MKNTTLKLHNLFHSLFVVLFILCFYSSKVRAQPFGYAWSKVGTIDAANVSGTTDHTDFPVLLHLIDPDLRTTVNGGHVYSAIGNDIIFTLDDCSQPLYHQIERYVPTTGELLVWVRFPVLYATGNTLFHMYYGNSSVASPTESANTWNSSYKMVQHLQNSPGGLSPQMKDASTNTNNGTANGGMTIANCVTGMIDEALSFDGINDYIVVPGFDYSSAPLGFTVSFWFKIVDNSGTSYQYMYSHNNYGLQHSLNVYFAESSCPVVGDIDVLKTIFMDQNDAISTEGLDSSPSYTDGNWHYYTFVVGNAPGGDWVYVDGVEIATLSFQGSDPYTPPGNVFLGARSDLNATRFLKGFLDEVHIANDPRSADWIKTEFDNQTSPMGFATFGPETDAYINCAPLPVELIAFNATALNDRHVLTDWITVSEINSDYFVVERTTDGVQFEAIGTMDAVGTTSDQNHYEMIDEHALAGTSYYRLKEVDLDGTFTYSELKSVNFEGISILSAFPNPGTEDINFIIYSTTETAFELSITDATGRIVERGTLSLDEGSNNFELSLTNYAKGQYFLRVGNDQTQHISQVFYVH